MQHILDYVNNEFILKNKYSIPDEWQNQINYICQIKEKYYISVWEEGLYCASDLNRLKDMGFKDIGKSLEIQGSPYYINEDCLKSQWFICISITNPWFF